jgi:ElaB/YqjD/DUF883 family membrane-anchored ribosome-binding protein
MFDSSELRDELQTLKDDVARQLNTTSGDISKASKSRAHTLADQVTAALNGLNETLSEQENHVEHIISDRAVTSLASVFALGVMAGFMLRRP